MTEKTIQTEYGETTIEVVECSSCGAEVAKSDAKQFKLGARDGWACEHCVDAGPVSFPERARSFGLGVDHEGDSAIWSILFFPIFFVTSLLWMPYTSIDPDNTTDMWLQGYATAIYSVLIWGLLLLGLVVIL